MNKNLCSTYPQWMLEKYLPTSQIVQNLTRTVEIIIRTRLTGIHIFRRHVIIIFQVLDRVVHVIIVRRFHAFI